MDARQLMVAKWKGKGEHTLATAFASSWLSPKLAFCRSELSPLGGLPNDNNGLEGTNSAQKSDLKFERYGLTQFLPKFTTFLFNTSCDDVGMSLKMDLQNTAGDVWNMEMFKLALAQRDAFHDGGGVFSCRFSVLDPDDSSIKWIIIPSRRVLALLKDQHHVPDDPKSIKKALSHTGKCSGNCVDRLCPGSWFAHYWNLSQASALGHPLPRYNFDNYIDFSSSFRTLKPITNVVYVRHLIDRLQASQVTLDLTLIQTDGVLDVEKLKEKGFASCNCPDYLKDLWCWHTTTYSLLKKLITQIPAVFQPRRILNQPPQKGRTARAVYGGALGWW